MSDYPTRSVVTQHGTAMGEATLCDEHFEDAELRGFSECVALGAEDVGLPLTWERSTGNNSVRCVECE